MSREIKFRAWGKKTNTMYSWQIMMDSFKNYGLDDTSNSLVIMQFTGLKDKNGKEIYEGDIVKQYQTSRGHVYAKQNPRVIKWVNGAHSTGFNISERGTHRTEVIGNIYENPELLEDS